MKTLKVYLDTSVIGGCFDKEFEEDSNLIIKLVKLGIYEGVISDITINELMGAPENVKDLLKSLADNLVVLELNEEVIRLSNEYLKTNIVSEKFKEDALHIAFATVFNIDVLVSWNFKHIVNLSKIKQFNSINMIQGYKILEIRSPRELTYEKK
jgi:predicted nucleic acid-binding protein